MVKPTQTLREAVRQALGGVSRQALEQRADRIRKKLPMTKDDAVAVIGHQQGVDISRWLDESSLSRISSYVAQLTGTAARQPSQSPSRSAKQKSVSIEMAGVRIGHIPGLTASHAKEAQLMAEKVYSVLYIFENSARDLITRLLEAALGSEWWEQIPEEVRNQAAKNMKKEGLEAWHSKRGEPIQFVDLPQLKNIVRDRALWPHFKPIFNRETWFDSVVDDMNVSRRVVAHMNPLSADDIKSVENGFRKWVRQLQANETQVP
jgi:hypothetical protein